ncbi:MAG: hypothetical protein JXA73_23790 [Acidobacteria bacterium]|nr:hypothetical protein [Acidobacteriota bacterium]
MIVILSVRALSSDHIGYELDEAGQSRVPIFALMNDVSYEEFKKRRPGWAYWIGSRVALSIPPIEGKRIVAGLKAKGVLLNSPTLAIPHLLQMLWALNCY